MACAPEWPAACTGPATCSTRSMRAPARAAGAAASLQLSHLRRERAQHRALDPGGLHPLQHRLRRAALPCRQRGLEHDARIGHFTLLLVVGTRKRQSTLGLLLHRQREARLLFAVTGVATRARGVETRRQLARQGLAPGVT